VSVAGFIGLEDEQDFDLAAEEVGEYGGTRD